MNVLFENIIKLIKIFKQNLSTLLIKTQSFHRDMRLLFEEKLMHIMRKFIPNKKMIVDDRKPFD